MMIMPIGNAAIIDTGPLADCISSGLLIKEPVKAYTSEYIKYPKIKKTIVINIDVEYLSEN